MILAWWPDWGIRSPDELRLHALRGHLFECWVVSELYGGTSTIDNSSSLHFWRDHKGKEVDVLIEKGSKTIAVEIKAGATINADFSAAWNTTNTWPRIR